jgi:PAS domain S-box-containing protein
MSEDFGDSTGEGHGGLDVVSKFAYESSFRQCQ